MGSMKLFLYEFKIYLPLLDKDGKEIEPEKFFRIVQEIVQKFGGITMTSFVGNPVFRGFWIPEGSERLSEDWNSIFTVLTPRDEESVRFFREKRKSWEKQLNYEWLLITYHEERNIA
jgi:hypothetical protein